MNQKPIDIKAESLPWHSKLFGVMFLFGAVIVLTNPTYWWLSFGFALMGLALLSWHSGTEIDPATKTFREYNSCLFIRAGKREKFNEVESVFINASRVTQRMYTAHTGHSSTFQSTVYNAYLKFDDGRKIFLASRPDKTKLIRFLNPAVAALSSELVDNTVTHNPRA